MPLVRITGTEEVGKERKDIVMKELSRKLSAITGKPEKFILIIFEGPSDMLLNGSREKSFFLEIKSIGALDDGKTDKISDEFCRYLSSEFGMSDDRINIEFRDVPRDMWGWNRKTFA